MGHFALPDLLERLGIAPSLRAAAIGPIIARMACPGSECATWPQTAICDALGIDHALGGTRRTVVRTGQKRTDVLPLDDPGTVSP